MLGNAYAPSLSVLSLRESPVSTLVIMTSAPAIAAPCSSVTVPRMEALVFCARAAREVPRMSARTTSSEKITRDLQIDSFTFKNRIFIRLPSRRYLRKKRDHEIRMENKLPRIHGPFHPIAFKKEPNP